MARISAASRVAARKRRSCYNCTSTELVKDTTSIASVQCIFLISMDLPSSHLKKNYQKCHFDVVHP